jgi:imidazolonepropionase-like amidohydrolase
MEALQAATINPAKFFGKETELGTIEKGKLADLILLEADPLADISNTKKNKCRRSERTFIRPKWFGKNVD